MPYIGQEPITGNFIKLDNISVVNGQATYSMQKDSANFSPASAQQMLVSLNGIIQSPGSSFTISGHQISFASNLVTGDSIDFIIVYGDVLNVGTVSDSTITNDKLATAPTLISKGGGGTDGAIQLNCSQNTHGVKIKSPPHSAGQSYTLTLPSTAPSADKALITDGSGNLSFGSAGTHTLLNSTTLSSSTDVQIQGLMTGYNMYLVLYKIQRSTNLIPRFYFMSGSTILSSGYHTQAVYGSGSGNAQTYPDDGQGYMNLTSTWSGNQSATETPVVGHLYIIDPNDSNDYTYAYGQNCFWSSSNTLVANMNSMSSSTAQAQDGIRFYPSTGNFANGFIKLYGIS